MNPVISGNGEIALMCDDPKIVAYDGLEQWQIDQLVTPTSDSKASANMCLQTIDQIVNPVHGQRRQPPASSYPR